MPELRKDPITGTWVIISEERKKRPKYYQIVVDKDLSIPENCPFCPGNESLTPPETFALRPDHSQPNGPGWELRVVPNKFPALRVEGELRQSGEGLYDMINGIGAHEVMIETPLHTHTWFDGDPAVIRRHPAGRPGAHPGPGEGLALQVHHGLQELRPAAGATLSHSHSQLIALPVVPLRVQEEIDGARAHYKGRNAAFSATSSTTKASRQPPARRNQHFIVLAPTPRASPSRLAILPQAPQPCLRGAPDNELESIDSILSEDNPRAGASSFCNHPDYNFIIHNPPFADNKVGNFYHWHIESCRCWPRRRLRVGHRLLHQPRLPEESVQSLKPSERLFALRGISPGSRLFLGSLLFALGDGD